MILRSRLSGENRAQRETAAGDGPLEFALFVPPGAAPGTYKLDLLACDAANLAPIPAIDGATQVVLAPVEVVVR